MSEMLNEDRQGNVNFISWRFKLKLALQNRDLYDYVTGAKPRPVGDVSKDIVSAWIKKDVEAQTMIGLNVSSKIATKIANCKIAKDMTDKLISLYGTKTDVTLETSRIKFFTFVYDESKSAVQNCLEIVELANEISTENDPMKESWIMTRIMSVLPPKLAHFWTSYVYHFLSYMSVVGRVKLKEMRKKRKKRCEKYNT